METFALLTCCLLFSSVVSAGENGNSDDYRLLWSDEFEKDGSPDPKNWTFEKGFVRNEEFQWYQEDNAFCKDGKLVIEGRRGQKENPDYKEGSSNWKENRKFAEYTSSAITTKGLHSWKYGRFEVKARIKTQSGLWPAVWFLGVEGEWPSCGEIDLMEYYKGNILANACWGTGQRWKAEWNTSRKPVASFAGSGWDESFHVWRMDWDKDYIELYVDDILLNTIDLSKTVNPTDRGPQNPFHQPHYMLLNLAIGGSCGGDPSKTPFPTSYEIEYVRVYQKIAADQQENSR